MTATSAKVESVPSFWKKCWNSLVKCFNRDAACTCSDEKQANPKVEEPKGQEKESAK